MRIDAHGHAWAPPDRHPWVSEVLPGGATSLVYTVEDYLADCETLDVDAAVLVATPIHGPGSPYTLECLREREDLYGVVLVDVSAPDAGERARELLGTDRVLGFRLSADELRATPEAVWEALSDAGGHVNLMVAPEDYPDVARLAEEHPEVTFVLDHLGLFPGAEGYPADGEAFGAVRDVAARPNAYAKVTHTPSSARYPFPDVHDHVAALLDAFGVERLLWGSDYVYHFKRVLPWQTVEFLESVPVLSARDRRRLLGENYAALLPG
jgi:L-fuconolactonase